MSLIALLKRAGLRPKKGLGQNFLVDEMLAAHIADAALAPTSDRRGPMRLVEIGPGAGSLTLPLLKQAKRLWVIEQDTRLIPFLKKRVQGLGRLEVQQGDALTVDFRQLAQRLGGPLTVVANLPYHISTPLLFHLLAQGDAVETMVLMFQKEVAERIASPPNHKAYGTLSVHTQLWMTVEPLLSAPPTAFYPVPKVDSRVIRLVRRAHPLAPVGDVILFRKVVKAAFGQRRKTLRNALKTLAQQPDTWLLCADIDPGRRGESLSVVEFARLTQAFPGATTPQKSREG